MTDTAPNDLRRGERLHNPGNLRISSDAWSGLAPQQLDDAFFTFQTDFFGLRAMARVLLNYQLKGEIKPVTVATIVARWAPPSENNTIAYIADVCAHMPAQADTVLDLTDADTLVELVTAIVHHEQGRCIYADGLIASAVQNALA
jgi:hypothetical protein